MELADTAVLAKQYKEAVTNYELIISEKSPRAEEAMQRAVSAQHLAGAYAEADALATNLRPRTRRARCCRRCSFAARKAATCAR